MQKELFHESLEDALGSVVAALGGPKAVGAALWPEKTIEDAGKLLRHCLNNDRPEKLSLEQLLWLLKEGRKKNCHDAMDYLATACGYQEPDPIEPEDERAVLMRQFIEAQSQMQRLAKQMERVGLIKAA